MRPVSPLRAADPKHAPARVSAQAPVSAAQKDAEKTPREQLPVLDAFRSFLDGERKRMRSRMMALTVVCAFVLAVSVLAALISYRLLAARAESFRGDVSNLKSRVDGAIASLETVRKDILQKAEALSGEIEESRKVIEETQAKIGEAADQTKRMEALEKAVSDAGKDGAAVRDALRQEMEETLKSLRNDIEAVRREIGGVRVPAQGATERIVRVAGPAPLEIAVTPPNASRPIKCRIPIAE